MVEVPDEIIVCMEEVSLKVTADSIVNYIAVSTVKLDGARVEEGFQASKLMLYTIEPGQTKLKAVYSDVHKMTITCLSHYKGYLAAVTNTKTRDRLVVFYKFDGVKMDPKVQPQSNQNLAISISFDGDLIFLGDAYKNIRVLYLEDPEILKIHEKVDDPEKFISIKRLCSNKMNQKVVGVHTLRSAERNDYARLSKAEKQALALFSASESGYLRIYGLREKKLLECLAQVNIQD